MAQALKTTPVKNGQNVHNWRTSKDFAETVKQLVADNALVVKGEQARQRIVTTINAFVSKLKHGEKKEARELLCKKAGIVLRTFTRWQAEIEQREEIGGLVYDAAGEAGYDITPSSIRSLADAKRLNPGATPAEVVKKAMAPSWDQEPKVKVEPLAAFVEALNEYLRKTDNDAIGVIQTVTNSPIREKICAVLKGICG
jgi:hypothetical protein